MDTATAAFTPVLPPKPRRYGAVNWLGLKTLIEREIRRFLKVAVQTVFAPVVQTLLFLMVFTLATGRVAPVAGVRYADFLAPGLMMMGLLSNAFQNSSSSLLIAKVQGNAVDFLTPPLSAGELTLAFLAGAVARGLLVALVSAVAAAPLAHVLPRHWWAVLYFALTAAVIFGALGLIVGVWAEKIENNAAVTNFVITPLTFLSGTFYAVDRLPEPFRTLAHYNPVHFLIDGFRYGFIGVADLDLGVSAAITGALALGLSLACWRLLAIGWRLKT